MRYLIDIFDLPAEIKYRYEVQFPRLYQEYICVHKYRYVCKQCGSELYGEFKYESLYSNSNSCDRNRLKYLLNHRDSSPSEGFSSIDEEIEYLKRRVAAAEKYEQDALDRYNVSVATAVCPVCGMQLKQEKGYFMPDVHIYDAQNGHLSGDALRKQRHEAFGVTFYGDIEKDFQSLAAVRQNLEHEQVDFDVKAYAQACDVFVAGVASSQVSKIKNDSESLKTYILNLLHLENNIYSLQQQLTDLYYRRLRNDRSVVFELNNPVYQIKAEVKELHDVYQSSMKALSDAENYLPGVSMNLPTEPTAPVLSKPGLFNKKKVLEENEVLTAKYQAQMEAYQKEVQRCNEERDRLIAVERAAIIDEAQTRADAAKMALDEAESSLDSRISELKQRPVPAKAVKDLLDNEIAEAEELLKKTFAVRNELYAYDIIFGKYRDVVALSSFYEYLVSGRCTSLEGADGAYNIYESEIRLNRVISQLDTVIASLDDIKQNQYMMYQELSNINASLSRLNSTMDKALTSIQVIEANTTSMSEYMEHISKNSDVIAHNTAVTAYYSKVNAELTNALGYMVAFK